MQGIDYFQSHAILCVFQYYYGSYWKRYPVSFINGPLNTPARVYLTIIDRPTYTISRVKICLPLWNQETRYPEGCLYLQCMLTRVYLKTQPPI